MGARPDASENSPALAIERLNHDLLASIGQ
jgi:hypothetical protein